VNLDDLAQIRANFADPINAGIAGQVRADVTQDGRANVTDLSRAWAYRDRDARSIPDPVLVGGESSPQALSASSAIADLAPLGNVSQGNVRLSPMAAVDAALACLTCAPDMNAQPAEAKHGNHWQGALQTTRAGDDLAEDGNGTANEMFRASLQHEQYARSIAVPLPLNNAALPQTILPSAAPRREKAAVTGVSQRVNGSGSVAAVDAVLAALANDSEETAATAPVAHFKRADLPHNVQRLDGAISRLMIDFAIQDSSIDRFSGGFEEEPIPVGRGALKKPFAPSALKPSWRARING